MLFFWIYILCSVTNLGQNSDPTVVFEKGKNYFFYQDYKKTIQILKPLLYPKIILNNGEKELKCREYLGASYWFLKNKTRFESEFTAILIKNPFFSLDAFYYPSQMIESFKALKKRLISMKIIQKDKDLNDSKNKTKKNKKNKKSIITVVERKIYIEKHPIYPIFLPFGIPQFYNEQRLKGALFMIFQTLSLAVNITSWFLIDSLKGKDGYVSSGDFRQAQIFKISLYSALGTFIALYAGSVIDGYLNFKKTKQLKRPASIIINPDGTGTVITQH